MNTSSYSSSSGLAHAGAGTVTFPVTKILLLLFLLAVLVKQSRGNDNPKPEVPLTQISLEDLGEIEVTTASKEPVKASRIPAAIYVITQEDIRRSGAASIPEALRLAPGVEVARIDSNSWALGVRGFGSALSRSVLVLIDGRSVYTPLFAGVYWQVQDTLLEDIERIEVIRGPGGTIDQGFVNFRYGAGNGQSFNYRVYGKAFTRGPEFHSDRRQFDDWRMGQIGFRADWDLHKHDTLTLQGDLYNGDAGQSVGINSYSPPYMANVEQNVELGGGNLLGRWKRVLGTGSDVQLQTYYDRTNRKQANFAESRDTFDIDFVHRFALPFRQDFLWGAGVRLSSGNTTEVVPTVAFTPNHFTDKLYSAFVQDEIAVVPNKLSLTFGSKFLHNSYSGFEVEPGARVLWTPDPQQAVWAAITRAVRTPSRVEEDLQLTGLFVPDPLTFYRISGDRKFSSENLIGYEVGYRSLVKPRLYIDFAAFYNNYDHLLSIEPGTPYSENSPPPPHTVVPFFFRNGLLGKTSGFEIAPDWTPNGRWRLRGSYSYLYMDLKKHSGSVDTTTAGSTEGSSPHHQIMVQSSFDLPKKLEFDQTFRYVSALPAQRVGAYGTADVRFSWRASRSLELSVVGQNLFQPHHAEFGGDPGSLVGMRRSAYAKITWQTGQR